MYYIQINNLYKIRTIFIHICKDFYPKNKIFDADKLPKSPRLDKHKFSKTNIKKHWTQYTRSSSYTSCRIIITMYSTKSTIIYTTKRIILLCYSANAYGIACDLNILRITAFIVRATVLWFCTFRRGKRKKGFQTNHLPN